MISSVDYLKTLQGSVRSAEGAAIKKMQKKKSAVDFDPSQKKGLEIIFAKSFPVWQDKILQLLVEAFSKVH